MDLTKALSFACAHHQGILITLRSDGRPQSSNIAFGVGDDVHATFLDQIAEQVAGSDRR